MNIRSWITHPHVISNLYDDFIIFNTNKDILHNGGNQFCCPVRPSYGKNTEKTFTLLLLEKKKVRFGMTTDGYMTEFFCGTIPLTFDLVTFDFSVIYK